MRVIGGGIPWALGALVSWGVLGGCAQKQVPAGTAPDPLAGPRGLISEGRYEEAYQSLKETLAQASSGPQKREASYLQGYTTLFGRGDFQSAKAFLRTVVQNDARDGLTLGAQKMTADCQFWMGHYQTAAKEYKKLAALPDAGTLADYALFQAANCLLLEDKVGDAMDGFRDLVGRSPGSPMADCAQLSIINSFLKLQDFKNAKKEALRLSAMTKDRGLQEQVRQSITAMEETERFQEGKEGPP